MKKNYSIFLSDEVDFNSWKLARGSSLSEDSIDKEFSKKLRECMSIGCIVCVSNKNKTKMFAIDDNVLKSKIVNQEELDKIKKKILCSQ